MIGMDFEGVVRKLPFPFKQFVRYCHPNDILERSGLRCVKHFFFHMIPFIPFIPNTKFIEEFQDKEVVIISAKRHRINETIGYIKKYMKVKAFHFRGERRVHEEDWKLSRCEQENVAIFYEDRKFVARFLRDHEMKVIEV